MAGLQAFVATLFATTGAYEPPKAAMEHVTTGHRNPKQYFRSAFRTIVRDVTFSRALSVPTWMLHTPSPPSVAHKLLATTTPMQEACRSVKFSDITEGWSHQVSIRAYRLLKEDM